MYIGATIRCTRSRCKQYCRLFSLLSWKRCTKVDFVKFYVVVNNQDQVLPQIKDLAPAEQKTMNTAY
ncbi:hypothetical protein F4801DRAFT_538700 [Xylaria longipes]|nr:hypothetical protein F4801DRAFT_538700 [Xylaria longipes]